MGDVGDSFRALKAHKKALKDEHGVLCPGCQKKFPKAHPKILLPGQRCFCGHRDPRPRLCDCDTPPLVEQSQDGRLWHLACVTKDCHIDNPTTRLCESKREAINEWNQRKWLT